MLAPIQYLMQKQGRSRVGVEQEDSKVEQEQGMSKSRAGHELEQE